MNVTLLFISQNIFNFSFIDRFEGKSFTITNIRPIDSLFHFNNTWAIFVKIGKISNQLHAGIYKIYVKGFCFNGTAFFNNIYIITIKQFSQLLFIGCNFVFVNKCFIIITYDTFTCRKRLDEDPKVSIGC